MVGLLFEEMDGRLGFEGGGCCAPSRRAAPPEATAAAHFRSARIFIWRSGRLAFSRQEKTERDRDRAKADSSLVVAVKTGLNSRRTPFTPVLLCGSPWVNASSAERYHTQERDRSLIRTEERAVTELDRADRADMFWKPYCADPPDMLITRISHESVQPAWITQVAGANAAPCLPHVERASEQVSRESTNRVWSSWEDRMKGSLAV